LMAMATGQIRVPHPGTRSWQLVQLLQRGIRSGLADMGFGAAGQGLTLI